MRRVNALHIVGLLLACIGTAVFKRAESDELPWQLCLGGAQITLGMFCAVVAMRINRRHRTELMARKLRITGQLETRVKELETRLMAAELEARSAESALAEMTAGIAPIIASSNPRPALIPAPAREAGAADIASAGEGLVRLISHEARTPLCTIHAYSELLLDGDPLDEATRHGFFGIIHAESERLSLVLDSLLNLARMDAGALFARYEPVAFNALVARVVHSAIALADLRKVTIEMDLPADPARIQADEELLTQATRNLLAHVVKHTPPEGRVAVRVRTNTGGRNVLLEITGSRVGIAPKDLPSALDSFYGCGDFCTRDVPPGAAGLALTRRVVEAVHGGRTSVRAEGESCTLGFELPLVRTDVPVVPFAEVRDV